MLQIMTNPYIGAMVRHQQPLVLTRTLQEVQVILILRLIQNPQMLSTLFIRVVDLLSIQAGC